MKPPPRRQTASRLLWVCLAPVGAVLGSGCAVVSVAGAAAGAAISVTGAVVASGVTVTGKVIGKSIELVTPGPAKP